MSEKVAVKVRITGRVQMVGFRYFAKQWAEDLYLDGWVRNNNDGSVELEVEGKQATIQTFLKHLKEGPRIATVDEVKVDWSQFKNRFRGFRITY